MKIGSLFSGGGGGDLGFVNAGHQRAFGSEIATSASQWLGERLAAAQDGVYGDC